MGETDLVIGPEADTIRRIAHIVADHMAVSAQCIDFGSLETDRYLTMPDKAVLDERFSKSAVLLCQSTQCVIIRVVFGKNSAGASFNIYHRGMGGSRTRCLRVELICRQGIKTKQHYRQFSNA